MAVIQVARVALRVRHERDQVGVAWSKMHVLRGAQGMRSAAIAKKARSGGSSDATHDRRRKIPRVRRAHRPGKRRRKTQRKGKGTSTASRSRSLTGAILRRALASALKWIFAVPNGGHRAKSVAGKNEAEGAKAGVLT